MNDDILLLALSSLLPIERLELCSVCRQWLAANKADPQLWRHISLVPERLNASRLRAHDKLPCGHFDRDKNDEYSTVRMAACGILPITCEQLSRIPDISWVRTLVVDTSREDDGDRDDLAYLDDMSDQDEADAIMESERAEYDAGGSRLVAHLHKVFDALPPLPHLERLRFPLDWTETIERRNAEPLLARLAAWMRTLAALEYLDLGYAYHHMRYPDLARKYPNPWTAVWRAGVPEPAAPQVPIVQQHAQRKNARPKVTPRQPLQRKKWELATQLPVLFPRLRGLPHLQSCGITLAAIAKWPAAFRAQLEVVSVNVGSLSRSTCTDVSSLPRLFPNARRLRVSAEDSGRALIEGLLGFGPSLRSLYLLPGYVEDLSLWHGIERLSGLKELVIIGDIGAPSDEAKARGEIPGVALARQLSAVLPDCNVLVLHYENFDELGCGWSRLFTSEFEKHGDGFNMDGSNSGMHAEQSLHLDAMSRLFLQGACEPWQLLASPRTHHSPFGGSNAPALSAPLCGPLTEVLAGRMRMPAHWPTTARRVVEDLRLVQKEEAEHGTTCFKDPPLPKEWGDEEAGEEEDEDEDEDEDEGS
jgi:hypothetical protein